MMEQLYLALDRAGVVHAAATRHWRSGMSWDEAGSAAEEAVEETLCEENDYFKEVHGALITCMTCIVRVIEAERKAGVQWKQPT